MAKQGFHKFERTFGCVIFYRVGDRYYIRQKSRLSRRRVKTSKAFANTRASANRLAIGSCVAASVYRELPEAWKMFELYQKLTGLATRLQKEGKTVTEIRPMLQQQLYDWGYRKEINYPTIKPTSVPIIIRSHKECSELEIRQSANPKIKRSGKYSIRRIRKTRRSFNYTLVNLHFLNKNPFHLAFSICLLLEKSFQAAPP